MTTRRHRHFTVYWETFQSDTGPLCTSSCIFKCYMEWQCLSLCENCEMQSSEHIRLLFILFPHRQRAALYLYFEKLLAVCRRCAETRWNLTRVPPLSSIFSVSVWCSAEVTASVDTVLTIMLDNEHSAEQIPPVLPAQQRDKFAELPHPWVCTGAKQYTVCWAERKYLRNTTCYFFLFFFFFLRREARLPEVSFFWASLMEREIIMSWPVNNCAPQWDICHHDMLYVLHPDGPWPNREVPLLFRLLPCTVICYLLKADTHTHTRRQMQRRKEKASLKTFRYVLQNAHLEAIFLIRFCSFIIRKPEGPLGDVCSVGLRGSRANARLKRAIENPDPCQVVRGSEDRRTPQKIVLWRKINLSSRRRLRSKKKIRLTFPFSSTISLPLSPSLISFIWASQSLPLTLSVSVFKEKIKQLTMMIKVTGPIKLHMKWLSTLSQHLGQRNTHTLSLVFTLPLPNINGKTFIFGYLSWWHCVNSSQYLTWSAFKRSFSQVEH